MSKTVVIVTGDAEALISDPSTTPSNWTKGINCHMHKEEQFVRCPANSTRSCVSGYETFVSNLLEFERLGEIPLGVDPKRLDDGEGIQQTLENHMACWL